MSASLYDYRHDIASEQACWALIRRIRWPDGIRCPRCQHGQTWAMRDSAITFEGFLGVLKEIEIASLFHRS
jgi:hypothetical protein